MFPGTKRAFAEAGGGQFNDPRFVRLGLNLTAVVVQPRRFVVQPSRAGSGFARIEVWAEGIERSPYAWQ